MTITQVIADEMINLNILKAEISALGEQKKNAEKYIQDILSEYDANGDLPISESSVVTKKEEIKQMAMWN